jgi:PD-(D/E)XK nuclease superfamily protein
MTGGAYADLVAAYVSRRFACRSLKVYREINVGKTIIGKNRRIDVFCVSEITNKAFAIECKYQEVEGTVDEKIPYAIDDLQALPMAGCIAYAGRGFSPGVQHMLEASPHAAYCLPVPGPACVLIPTSSFLQACARMLVCMYDSHHRHAA